MSVLPTRRSFPRLLAFAGLGLAFTLGGCGSATDTSNNPEDESASDSLLADDQATSDSQGLAAGGPIDPSDPSGDDPAPVDCNQVKSTGDFLCQVSRMAGILDCNMKYAGCSSLAPCLTRVDSTYSVCEVKVQLSYTACLASP